MPALSEEEANETIRSLCFFSGHVVDCCLQFIKIKGAVEVAQDGAGEAVEVPIQHLSRVAAGTQQVGEVSQQDPCFVIVIASNSTIILVNIWDVVFSSSAFATDKK